MSSNVVPSQPLKGIILNRLLEDLSLIVNHETVDNIEDQVASIINISNDQDQKHNTDDTHTFDVNTVIFSPKSLQRSSCAETASINCVDWICRFRDYIKDVRPVLRALDVDSASCVELAMKGIMIYRLIHWQ
jgi:hypothetical protein